MKPANITGLVKMRMPEARRTLCNVSAQAEDSIWGSELGVRTIVVRVDYRRVEDSINVAHACTYSTWSVAVRMRDGQRCGFRGTPQPQGKLAVSWRA